MITSKLNREAQTTMPRPIGAALHLREGDEIVYVVEEGRVTMMKAAPVPADDPFATFGEWHSAADRKAYAGL